MNHTDTFFQDSLAVLIEMHPTNIKYSLMRWKNLGRVVTIFQRTQDLKNPKLETPEALPQENVNPGVSVMDICFCRFLDVVVVAILGVP